MNQFREVKAIQLTLDIVGKQRVFKVYINSKGDWTNSCRKSYQMLLEKKTVNADLSYMNIQLFTLRYMYLNAHLAKVNNLNLAWS